MDFSQDTKLLLKVRNGETTQWVHLCYVDTEVYSKFVELFGQVCEYLNKLLSKWCQEDFGVKLDMGTIEDLSELKDLIKTQYKMKYPEIYKDSTTDRQGWTRVWISSKMRKEIEDNGE